MFSTFGLTNAYGVYQDYYVRVHLSNYPPSTIGWIGSFQVFLRASGHLILHQRIHTDIIFLSEFAGSLFAGIWFDKGYFYPMTFGFSLLFLFSFVDTFPSLRKYRSDLFVKGTLCYHSPNHNSFIKSSSPKASAPALASRSSFFLRCPCSRITLYGDGHWRWASLRLDHLLEESSFRS